MKRRAESIPPAAIERSWNHLTRGTSRRRNAGRAAFVHRGLCVAVCLWLASQQVAALGVRPPRPETLQPQKVAVVVLEFRGDGGSMIGPELRRWLTSFLADQLTGASNGRVLPRARKRSGQNPSTEELVALGRELGVQFVISPGVLPVVYEKVRGEKRTRVALYVDVVSVDTGDTRRLDVAGVDSQTGADVESIDWDSVSPSSYDFLDSSFGRAMTTAFKKLAASVYGEIEGNLSATRAEPVPNTQAPGQQFQNSAGNSSGDLGASAANTEESQQAQADEELQQLIAQAQECISSMNASTQKINALIQALEGLKSALEAKANLMQDGRINQTDRADQQIEAQKQALEQAESQILPADPGQQALQQEGQQEPIPGEAQNTGGESKLDRVIKIVDFAFSVVEKIVDLRERFRGVREDPYAAVNPDTYNAGQDPGNAPLAGPLQEEPFVPVGGNIVEEDTGPQGHLTLEQPRLTAAVLRVPSGGYPERLSLSSVAFARSFGRSVSAAGFPVPTARRLRPVAGAEVIEPKSGASARTDAGGFYTIRVPARSTRLIVKIRGRQAAETHICLVGGRAKTADFVIRANSATDQGSRILPSRVVASQDGANTGVVNGLVEDAQGHSVARAMVELGRLAMARTDSQGRFAFSKVPAGSQQLTVRAGDLQPQSEQVRVRANEAIKTRIRLGSSSPSQGPRDRLVAPGAGTVLRGAVTDDRDRPLPGARASVIGSSASVNVLAGPTGKFELKDLKPGSYRILISKIGYADVAQPVTLRAGGNEQANFRMTPTNARFEREVLAAMGEVRGQVRGADRQPIANATVELRSSGKTAGGDRGMTNARGEFALKALQGRYELRVRRQGYQEFSASVEVHARDSIRSDVDMKASPGTKAGDGSKGAGVVGQLRGRVTDDGTGRPIVSARVSIGGQSDTTDASGDYEIANLPPGHHQVSVTSNGYENGSDSAEVKAGSVTSRNFKLLKKSAGSHSVLGQVRGRVTDDRTGRPIVSARVSIKGLSDTTDANGNYEIANLEPGQYRVGVTSNSYENGSDSVEVKAGSASSRDFKLRAKSGLVSPGALGQLRGRVTDDGTGRPLANVTVSFGRQSDTTDASGNYEIANVEPGRQQVSVTRNGYDNRSDQVEVKAGSATSRDFKLRAKSEPGGHGALGQLRGRVTDDRTGRPISGARASAQGRSGLTDHTGSYLIENLPAGRYQVVVTSNGYSSESTSAEIKAGNSTNKDFDLKPTGNPGKGDDRVGVGQVRGRVSDDKTGKPVSGARVSVAGRSDTTDQSGSYLINGVPAGRHPVSVSRSGYSGGSSSVDVKGGGSATKNFELKPYGSVNRNQALNRDPKRSSVPNSNGTLNRNSNPTVKHSSSTVQSSKRPKN